MKKKTDFENCPYIEDQPCPGYIGGYEGRSSSTVHITSNGQKINVLDFARDHDYECSSCLINAKS